MMPAIDPPAGWTIRHEQSVGSTNDVAGEMASQGAPEGTIVWADRQVSGRGRAGRGWVSPEGNLYCSAVIRPGDDLSKAACLSFVVATALHAAIADLFPAAQPLLKWPNDILAGGAKLSGILLEAGSGGGTPYVVAGTGVNIASAPEADYPTAALADFAKPGQASSPAGLLSAYLFALAERLALWRGQGFAPIRAEWLDHCTGLGQPVTARSGGGTEQGIFEGLGSDGALLLRRPDRSLSTILAADVFFSSAVQQEAT